MLLSRMKCLKTKESQLQAEVHGHSTSLRFPAWPSPSCSPWPQTQLLLPTLHTRQCLEPLKCHLLGLSDPGQPHQCHLPLSLPSYPVIPGQPHHQFQSQSTPAAAFWHYVLNHLIILHNWLWSGVSKTWLQHELLQELNNDKDIPILQYPGIFSLISHISPGLN